MVTCLHNTAAGQLCGNMPLFGPTLPSHVPTIFQPSILPPSNPEKNLAMSLPSEKEETEFLYHSWAKATLQMFTRGGSPCCFAMSRNAWALLFLGASPSLVILKWKSS